MIISQLFHTHLTLISQYFTFNSHPCCPYSPCLTSMPPYMSSIHCPTHRLPRYLELLRLKLKVNSASNLLKFKFQTKFKKCLRMEVMGLKTRDTICRYYQTVFCKFGNHCSKKHENETCGDQSNYRKQNCAKKVKAPRRLCEPTY